MSCRFISMSALSLGAAVAWGSYSSAEVVVQRGPIPTQGDFHFHATEKDKKKGKDKEAIIKTRRSLSGVACPVVMADGRHICLGAFDEGVEARTFSLSATEYEARDAPVVLSPDGEEMDSEAVAAAGNFYYVTGSHAMSREHCNEGPNETSYRVVKIEYDPSTGLPLRNDDGELKSLNDRFRIADLLDGTLAASVGKCLGLSTGDNGFDVEGLAAYKDKLYFGLRGPTTNGKANGTVAYVVEGNLSTFDRKKDDPKPVEKADPFQIKVGDGHAIRDLASVDDGILILVGPNDDDMEATDPRYTWSILFWKVDEADRKPKTVDLGELKLWKPRADGCDKEVKPEGMAVLGHQTGGDQETYLLAIFSDGMCDGGPVIATASRPK
ncbi:DUF3616 domain-containing protein (plasmid) [Rhizobium leguminosarum]